MKAYESMYVVPKERYLSMIGKSPATPVQSLPSLEQSHSTNDVTPSSLCPVDGKDFKHPNILAHHMKSHVNGLKCNLCGKILKNMSSLRKHLKRHGPQVPPSPAGPLPGRKAAPSGPPRGRAAPSGPPREGAGPLPGRKAAPSGPPREGAGPLKCRVCNKNMKHKRNLSRHMRLHKNSFTLKVSKWETLT